jgi:putative Mg2+ transporter-C (MgtC) family protein
MSLEPVGQVGGAAEIAMRLLAAALIGGGLGLNRELKEKPAGLRTHALVSLGSALIVVTSLQLVPAGPGGAPTGDAGAVTRVVQGIMTGIGFLGGGVILRGNGPDGAGVRNLTTAATIWIAAALGIACGAGRWVTAILALAITLVVLIAGRYVERFIHRRQSYRDS